MSASTRQIGNCIVSYDCQRLWLMIDPGFTSSARDLYMSAVYSNIYKFARNGGTLGGGLVWQVLAQGMQPYDDGYEIVLAENPSTGAVISRQSHAMSTLSHLVSATD